jgi:site-specific DNA recombinase
VTAVAQAQTSFQRRGDRVQLPTRPGGQAPVRTTRAAIYCRKSTDENLHSDFSSLDAQREACQAYVASMKSEGWVALPRAYEDAAITGGTIDRPALQRLMDDIQRGHVDAIVVVKLDRLSRSLSQFLQLMEFFEEHHIAFCAVTQQINTASSAGRLLVNVLMSFAQFEREIGSERTREKIHAARKKGRYIGGHPPLGYDIDKATHRLVVNPDEAQMIRELFDLYLEHQSLLAVVQEANARGWRRKSWQTTRGIERVGARFEKVYLQRLLINPLYIGQVTLKGKTFPGLHEAMVREDTFHQVQDLLQANRREKNPAKHNKHGALLRGLLRCNLCGCGLSHTFTRRGVKLYRYYLCTTVTKQGRSACASPQIPAGDLEAQVVSEIRRQVKEPASLQELLRSVDTNHREELKQRLIRFDRLWDVLEPQGRIQLIHEMIDEIIYHHPEGRLEIRFRVDTDPDNTNTHAGDSEPLAEPSVIW